MKFYILHLWKYNELTLKDHGQGTDKSDFTKTQYTPELQQKKKILDPRVTDI